MKTFNINHHLYVQITEHGWQHLKNTVGDDYIKHCIEPYKVKINNEDWYKLQCHSVFELMPPHMTQPLLFNTDVMIDEDELEN